MSTTTNVTNLIINKLTKAQYEAIQNPDPTQLYFIIDDNEYAEVSDLPQPSNTAPGMDGTAAAGVAATYSRSDHIHPTDTSRAPINSPAFTGQPTTPTPLGVTTTINGLQNISLNNLTDWPDSNNSKALMMTLGTWTTDLTDADFLNVTLDGVNYTLPRKGSTEFQGENNVSGIVTIWGGAISTEEAPYFEPDFEKYPLAFVHLDTGSTGTIAIGLPLDYSEENSSVSINSYTSKPDANKVVNVGYLESVLENYESASSLRPEDDENVLNALISLGLANVLTDTDNSVLIDNDNVAIGGHNNGNSPLFYNQGR